MVLNQASNVMLGSQEVQKVYLGTKLVWERKKAYNMAKINLILLDEHHQETSDIQYFDTVTEVRIALDNNKGKLYKVVIGEEAGIMEITPNIFQECMNLFDIIIPDTINSIGDYAFVCCTALANLIIPSSVKSVGTGAFSMCDSLTSILFHDGLESIAGAVFFDCGLLTHITIPATVTSIADNAFFNTSLKEITIHKPENSISGSPWLATNAEIIWTG